MKTEKSLSVFGFFALLCAGILMLSSCRKTPAVVINIQPLDGITDVGAVTDELVENYFTPLGIKNFEIRILPHKTTPDSAFNAARTRYRAAKIMNFLHAATPPGEFTIGVTDKDISTSIHGSDDYGILGISRLGYGRRACITSTFRLRDKKDLWKLMAHEFTHGFYNQPHCKVDDDACIMQDAKGGNPKFEKKSYLCPRCRDEVEKKMR